RSRANIAPRMIVGRTGGGGVALRVGAGRVRISMMILQWGWNVVRTAAVLCLAVRTTVVRSWVKGFRTRAPPSERDVRELVVELIERGAAGTDTDDLRAGERVLGSGQDRVTAND